MLPVKLMFKNSRVKKTSDLIKEPTTLDRLLSVRQNKGFKERVEEEEKFIKIAIRD